jgi:hypothetical protein
VLSAHGHRRSGDAQSSQQRTAAKIIVKDLDILETRAEAELRQSNQRGPSFYIHDDDEMLTTSTRRYQLGVEDSSTEQLHIAASRKLLGLFFILSCPWWLPQYHPFYCP